MTEGTPARLLGTEERLRKNLMSGPPARLADDMAEYPVTETLSKGTRLKKGRIG